jgi:hypothetical protein
MVGFTGVHMSMVGFTGVHTVHGHFPSGFIVNFNGKLKANT